MLIKKPHYPDVMLGCSEKETDDYALSQPCLIIEVLSPATASTDKREKLLASPVFRNIVRWHKINIALKDIPETNNKSYLDYYSQQDSVPFVCLDCEIAVMDIYAGVLN